MKLLLTTLSIFLSLILFSQKVTWGPQFENQEKIGLMGKMPIMHGVLEMIGESDGKIYCSSSKKKYLLIFDAITLNLISRNEINCSTKGIKKIIDGTLSLSLVNDKLTLIGKFYYKAKKEDKIIAHEINDMGKSIKSVVLLDYFETRASDSKTPSTPDLLDDTYRTDYEHIIFSPDSTKILIGYSYFNKKEGSYEALVSTFNSDLEPLTKKMLIKSKYSTKKYLNQCSYTFGISNEGEWLACSRVWNKGVSPDVMALTQCLEFQGFNKLGGLKKSSQLLLDNLTIFSPQSILPVSSTLDSFILIGKYYDNPKRKIKLDHEFKGSINFANPNGVFTCLIFKPDLVKVDLSKTSVNDGSSLFNFSFGPALYSNGFVVALKPAGLESNQSILYYNSTGKLNTKSEFYVQSIPGNFALNYGGDYALHNYSVEDAPLVALTSSSGQITYIAYDILERDINSSEKFIIDKSNSRDIHVALVQITIDESGNKTRTVLDDGKIDFMAYTGISLKMNDGSLLIFGVSGANGKLIKITP
jgi:hypothetical protein